MKHEPIQTKVHPNEQIAEIMAETDFHKIQRVMELLDWQWQNSGVPSKIQLRDTAFQLLQSVAADKALVCSATGGFTARSDRHGQLSLVFVLSGHSFSDPVIEA